MNGESGFMTMAQFLKALPRRGWVLKPGGKIRRADTDHCPDIFVFIARGRKETLRNPEQVWKAADNARGHDEALRRKLLVACGLVKKAKAAR